MFTKTVMAIYALTGGAVVASIFYTKKLESDGDKFLKKVEKDMQAIRENPYLLPRKF